MARENWKALLARIRATGTPDDDWYIAWPDAEEYERFRQAAIERVRECGVPVSTEDGWEWQWDGKVINTGRPKGGKGNTHDIQHPGNILHDLAHWAICPPSRLGVVDFGLGRGPDSVSTDKAPFEIGHVEGQLEEERASLLGILMELDMGMPAGDTFKLHQWIFDTYNDKVWRGMAKALDLLREQGFITSRGRVRWAKVSQGMAE